MSIRGYINDFMISGQRWKPCGHYSKVCFFAIWIFTHDGVNSSHRWHYHCRFRVKKNYDFFHDVTVVCEYPSNRYQAKKLPKEPSFSLF
nr:MAG TPA: hypothetical protein [Caudoviricetes sp.]